MSYWIVRDNRDNINVVGKYEYLGQIIVGDFIWGKKEDAIEFALLKMAVATYHCSQRLMDPSEWAEAIVNAYGQEVLYLPDDEEEDE